MQENPIRIALEAYVDKGEVAGMATLVCRGGVVQTTSLGRRDLVTRLPVERDTIFRLASMTKPITTVAALMLLEEGRFTLDESIATCAPEFTRLRVLRRPEGPLDETHPAERPITFRDLLTHRSGLTYGEFRRGPIARAHADVLGGLMDNAMKPDEWIARLASLPLIDQPGAGFHYGPSTDLLGFLIARLDDAPLGAVLKRRIFEPLGMKDTGFFVPREKRVRRAGLCGFDGEGALTALTVAPGGHALADRPEDMAFESGGQGLWSTLDDYLAFARMFVGAHAVDAVRLLRPETLAMMSSNQLTPHQRATARMLGRPAFAAGHGYGMGVAVVMEPEKADVVQGRGGMGTVGWPGAYGGWWQADPTNDTVLIFLAHNMADLQQMTKGIGFGIWSAIAEFHSLAVG
ncbi:MAG: serine hydrolase domain-containing protein [bacterium]